MGFIPDVERIVSLLPQPRQTLMFSATMPPEIRRLADAFLRNPVEIAVAPPASPAATVVQSLTVVDAHDKREALRRLLRSEDVKNALIFCNRKRDVDILYNSLARHGFDAAALHGDMAQPKRTETLERFRRGEIRLLVASDVAARGLDIKGMSHVFCFDVPLHAEDYVHRIGRTGRAGQSGRSFMLAASEDGRAVAAIVKLIGREIPPAAIDGIAPAELVYDEGERRRSRRSSRSAQPPRNGHADAARSKLPAARRAVGPLVRAAPTKSGINLTPAAAVAAARPLRPLEAGAERGCSADRRVRRPSAGLSRPTAADRRAALRRVDEDDIRHGQMRPRPGLRGRGRGGRRHRRGFGGLFDFGPVRSLAEGVSARRRRYRAFRYRAVADPARRQGHVHDHCVQGVLHGSHLEPPSLEHA